MARWLVAMSPLVSTTNPDAWVVGVHSATTLACHCIERAEGAAANGAAAAVDENAAVATQIFEALQNAQEEVKGLDPFAEPSEAPPTPVVPLRDVGGDAVEPGGQARSVFVIFIAALEGRDEIGRRGLCGLQAAGLEVLGRHRRRGVDGDDVVGQRRLAREPQRDAGRGQDEAQQSQHAQRQQGQLAREYAAARHALQRREVREEDCGPVQVRQADQVPQDHHRQREEKPQDIGMLKG